MPSNYWSNILRAAVRSIVAFQSTKNSDRANDICCTSLFQYLVSLLFSSLPTIGTQFRCRRIRSARTALQGGSACTPRDKPSGCVSSTSTPDPWVSDSDVIRWTHHPPRLSRVYSSIIVHRSPNGRTAIFVRPWHATCGLRPNHPPPH
jgi:hypothetical protein